MVARLPPSEALLRHRIRWLLSAKSQRAGFIRGLALCVGTTGRPQRRIEVSRGVGDGSTRLGKWSARANGLEGDAVSSGSGGVAATLSGNGTGTVHPMRLP